MILLRQLLIITFCACLLIGCTTGPVNPNTATVPPTPSPSASPSPASTTTNAASVQITLPLLDALLSDEKFVAHLKTKLKLSDDKIDELKRVSSAEIAHLRESNAEETDGGAGDARTRAAEQLRSILGDDKARELT